MSAIVWLMVDGELQKCRVDDLAAEMFNAYHHSILQAKKSKDFDAVRSLVACRTEAAAQVVASGKYEVVRSIQPWEPRP